MDEAMGMGYSCYGGDVINFQVPFSLYLRKKKF